MAVNRADAVAAVIKPVEHRLDLRMVDRSAFAVGDEVLLADIGDIGRIAVFGVLGAMMLGFLGLMTSVWAEKFDHAAAVTNFVVTPLALLSGTFYSVDKLAPWFQTIAHGNPVYYAIMGFRYGFIGTVDSTIANPVLTAALVLVAVNILLGVITYRLLASGWKLKA